MSDKRLKTYEKRPIIKQDIYVHQPITEIPRKPKLALPYVEIIIAFVLFMLAYAGPDIGNVLAYIIVPLLGFFPGLLVWEKWGKAAGIFSGLFVVALLAPVYGRTIVDNCISLFTSLQTISQGFLVLGALTFFIFFVITLFTGRRG